MKKVRNYFLVFVLIVVAQKSNCRILRYKNKVLKEDQIDYSLHDNDNGLNSENGNKSKYFGSDQKKIININKSNQLDGGEDDEYIYVDDKNREDNQDDKNRGSYRMKESEDSALIVSKYKHDVPEKSKSSSMLEVVHDPIIFPGFSYISDDICKKNKSDLNNNGSDRDHNEKDKIQNMKLYEDAGDFLVHYKNSLKNKLLNLPGKSHQHNSNSEVIAINDQNSRSKGTFFMPYDDSMNYNQADSIELNYQTVTTEKLHNIWHNHKLKDKVSKLNGETVRMDNRTFHRFPKSQLKEEHHFNADNSHKNQKISKMRKPFESKHSYNTDYIKNYYPYRNNNYEISNKNLSPAVIRSANLKKKFRNKAKFTPVSELSKENTIPKIVYTQNDNLFRYNNLNDYTRKLRNAFTAGEEGSNDLSNHMHLMRKKNKHPLFIKSSSRSMEESLVNNEADHSKNSSGSIRFENNSRSMEASENNHFINQINYPDLNVFKKNQCRNEKNLLADLNADRNEILEGPVQNFLDYEIMSVNKVRGEDFNVHNSFEVRDNQEPESKKRSILNRLNVVSRPFLPISADGSDYSQVITNLSKGNIRSSKITYDYDLNENSENAAENDYDNNVSQNVFRDEGISKLSSEVINDLQKSEEDVKLFKQKSAVKSVHIPLESKDVNLDNQFVVSNIKKYKVKPKKIDQTAEDSSHYLKITSPKFTFSKVSSENEGSVHLAGKAIGRQCHPAAGPPKFRWCSENSDPIKDQEYEDALKGKVALRIVEVILAKIQKSPKMLSDFGFCNNKKKPSANGEETDCSAQSSILNSEDLKQIMLSIDNMSYKGCNQLPSKLKKFLEWLVNVKDVRSVHSKDTDSEKHLHSNCSPGDSAFLFHKYNAESSSGFVQPEESKGSISNIIPNKKSSIDNDDYYSSYDKNFADGINGDSLNFVGSDENLVEENRNLMSKHEKSGLLKKYKKQVSDDNVNYYRDDINSDIKYS